MVRVTKLCVKDCVCVTKTKLCVKDCACDKVVCDKVVCERCCVTKRYVTKLCVCDREAAEREEEDEERDTESKTRTPHKDVGKKRNYQWNTREAGKHPASAGPHWAPGCWRSFMFFWRQRQKLHEAAKLI